MSGDKNAAEAMVLFRIGGRLCALRQAETRAVLALPRLWTPPGLPNEISGFANIAGRAVAIIDLVTLFLLDADATVDPIYRQMLLLRDGAVALLVDRVEDVVPLPAALRAGRADEFLGCVAAEVDLGAGLIHLLATDRLLSLRERRILDSLRDTAQRRLAAWEAAAP